MSQSIYDQNRLVDVGNLVISKFNDILGHWSRQPQDTETVSDNIWQ